MTSAFSRSRRKAYRDDLQRFFDRHPVGFFVFTFPLLFTVWSILGLFAPSLSSGSYGGHILGAVCYAGIVTLIVFFLQRSRRKRDASPSGDG